MSAAASEMAFCSPEVGCITCGDVALPLSVLLIDSDRGLALCRDASDRRETVEIALVGTSRSATSSSSTPAPRSLHLGGG